MAAHWSDPYVDLPYVEETGDCAALAERVAFEVFGKRVGLPTSHASTYRAQSAQILGCKDEYAARIDEPEDGGPALFVARGHFCHIGVMCWLAGEWWVLHADQTFGAVLRQRLRDVTRINYKLEGFYRWL